MRSEKEIREALEVQEKKAKECLQKANGSGNAAERQFHTKQHQKMNERVQLLNWVLNQE